MSMQQIHQYLVSPPQSLKALCIRALSTQQMVSGYLNGRPTVINSTSFLYPHKMVEAVLSMARNPEIPASGKKVISDHLGEAMNIMYEKMGAKKGIEQPTINMDFAGMYMGASAGLHPQGAEVKKEVDGIHYTSSNKGKRLEHFPADMRAIAHALQQKVCPHIVWKISGKLEYFINRMKQENKADHDAWVNKLRLFVIPNSILYYLEKMVSDIRHRKERGRVILIGMKWTRGGAYHLSKKLGVTKANQWVKNMVEGDIKNMDQSINQFFMNLYYSTMLYHEDPNHPNYAIKKMIVEWIRDATVQRVTYLFGSIWAEIQGVVPSGCFNTVTWTLG